MTYYYPYCVNAAYYARGQIACVPQQLLAMYIGSQPSSSDQSSDCLLRVVVAAAAV